jgi:hypothetical protein
MLAVYIEMKRRSKGHLRLSTSDVKNICERLNISLPTFYKYRNQLIKENWIGHNRSKGLYHIRSWKFVQKLLGLQGRSNVEGHVDNLPTLQQFCFAADLSHYIKIRKKKSQPHTSGCKQRDLVPDFDAFSLISGERSHAEKLGVVHLAERYGVSKQTISVWKAHSRNLQYFNYQHHFAALNIEANRVEEVRKAYPEYAHRILVIDRECYVQLTDSFDSEYKFYSTR